MQMAAGGILNAAAPNNAGTGVKGVNAGASEGGFPQMFVQFITGSPSPSAAYALQSNTVANALAGGYIPLLSNGTSDDDPVLLTEELMQIFGDGNDRALLEEADSEQLGQMIRQLQALLIAMEMSQGGESGKSAAAGSAGEGEFQHVQSVLKELLHQLHAVIKPNDTSSPDNVFAPMIADQLKAIKRLISGKADPAQSLPNARPDNAVDLNGRSFEIVSPVQSAQTHLLKLSRNISRFDLIAGDHNKAAGQVAAETANQGEPVEGTGFGSGLTNAQEIARAGAAIPKAALQQQVPIQDFAETMGSFLVKQLKVSNVNGVSEAKISLYPEQLGQVDIRITVQNGQVTALFMTETGLAKEMIDNQLTQLRAALQLQGLQVDKLEVAQSGMESQLFQDGGHSKQGREHMPKHNQTKSGGGFENEFETELVEQAVIQELGYGRAINVMA